MLVDELGLAIATKQDGIAVEPSHIALKADPIDQKDRDRHLVLASVLQKGGNYSPPSPERVYAVKSAAYANIE